MPGKIIQNKDGSYKWVEGKKNIAVHMTHEKYNAFKDKAENEGVNRSDLLRAWIQEYLDGKRN